MDYKGIKVLVLDGYGRQIPSILHQLHKLGCIITTINESKLDVGYTSRYPKKKIVQNGIREDIKLYREVIKEELLSGNYDVAFPMLEKSTEIMYALQREKIITKVRIIAAPYNAFVKAYNKQDTMRICTENDIPCPKTKMDYETLDEFLSRVNFPLACKPRRGSGSAGFKRVNNREELDKYIADGVIVVEDYVVQEYIENIEYMVNNYIMLDDNQRLLFSLVGKCFRWYPIDGGPACFTRTVDMPDTCAAAVKLLQKMGWAGFAQVSMMMDGKDNIPKVAEINGRISAGIKLSEYAGCTPVKYMLDRAYGQVMQPMTKPIREGLGLRYFHTDFMWLIKSPNRFKAKPSWFDFRNSKDYIFSWSDPIPFFGYAIEHIMTYKKDMKKRSH